MVEVEAELAREVADWLARAQAEDAAEDAEHGATRRGDERASAPPKPSSRRRPGRQKPRGGHRLAPQKAPPNRGRADRASIHQVSQNPRPNATSPIRKAGS
jgi:hypothetical protein